MKNIAAIILAAGEGTRMKSSIPKVLHPVCGKPIVKYLVDTMRSIGIKNIIVVVGHKEDLVKRELQGVKWVKQAECLGTADAALRTKKFLSADDNIDSVLISYGDTPLLTTKTLKNIIDRHTSSKSGCTLLTAHLKNPTGYGRILRSSNDKIMKIVEELEAVIYEKVK